MVAQEQAFIFLQLLFENASGLIELRSPRGDQWRRWWFDAPEADYAAEAAARLAPGSDVYVGVLPRGRRGGTRADLVPNGRVAWVDLDGADGIERLRRFAVPPSIVVGSGTPGHVHAYWRMDRPLPHAWLENLNRALAATLGGDPASFDAARVLRVPGTLSHKHAPPANVPLLHIATQRTPLTALTAAVRPLPPRRPAHHMPRALRGRVENVPPEVYVPALTGVEVPRSRKIRCPLHDDSTPSFHVYEDARRGWFCFGCRRGGSIFDLAAALWKRPTRGRAFVELRRDLERLLCGRSR